MQTWHGKHLQVNILHSTAGVAQQILISHDHVAVLFDAGDGILRDLLDNEFTFEQISGVVLTHGHFDHMGGLFSLLGFMRMIGREESLPICFPAGSVEIRFTLDAFAKSYPATTPFAIDSRELVPGTTFELAGMQITAFEAIHCGGTATGGILDRIPALGFCVTYRGESIAISGDTGDSPALREMVREVDLAILEATHCTDAGAGRETLQKVHLSAERASEIGRTAKEFILVHQSRER